MNRDILERMDNHEIPVSEFYIMRDARDEIVRLRTALQNVEGHLAGAGMKTANLNDPKENAIYLALHETRAALKASA